MAVDSNSQHTTWIIGLALAVTLVAESGIAAFSMSDTHPIAAILSLATLLSIVETAWLGINFSKDRDCIPSLWNFSIAVVTTVAVGTGILAILCLTIPAMEIALITGGISGACLLVAARMCLRTLAAKGRGEPLCSLRAVQITTMAICLLYILVLGIFWIAIYALSHLQL